jgi:hypothetical protein
MGIYLSVLVITLIIIFFAKKKEISKRTNKKLYTESNKESICTNTKEAHQTSTINKEVSENPVIHNSEVATHSKQESEIYRYQIGENNSNDLFTAKIKRLISERDKQLTASKPDIVVDCSDIEDYDTADGLGKKLIALKEKFQGLNSHEHPYLNHCSATTNKNKYSNNIHPVGSFKQRKSYALKKQYERDVATYSGKAKSLGISVEMYIERFIDQPKSQNANTSGIGGKGLGGGT